MSSEFWQAFWIILTGFFAAGACGLLGCFLVLRRMALLGDAVSHAVLPGIALAFLISGSRTTAPMLVGAGLFGILATFLIEALHRSGRVQEDASIGITFTSLFALGVLLITATHGDQVDLDTECVLYGEIAYVPLDPLFVIKGRGEEVVFPRATVILGSLFVVNIVFICTFWKQLGISSFDPGHARTIGIRVTVIHYLLMGMVSMTVVGAFESVGAILVVAMLIVPGATAYLLTDRLSTMLCLSVLVGLLCSFGGYGLSARLNASIAGSMAVVAGALFTVAFLVAPRYGVITRSATRRLLAVRLRTKSLLEYLEQSEREAMDLSEDQLAAALGWRRGHTRVVVRSARQRGFVSEAAGRVYLTGRGKQELSHLGRHKAET